MKRIYRIRDFLAGAIAMMLIVGLSLPVKAALTDKTINVRSGVSIYVDGVKLNPKDVNGNSVETFIYNGTTYVPARALSECLGKNVSYDGSTQSVYIGTASGDARYLLDVCPPYQTKNYKASATITMSGKKYANGFIFDWNNGFALFNLNGQYDFLSFDVGHVDSSVSMRDATINIYLDGNLTDSIAVDAEDLVRHVEIPLDGALQMKMEYTFSGGGTLAYGIAEAKVK